MHKISCAAALVAILLLGAACADSDLSTPEGRERDARLRAIARDSFNNIPSYTPQPTRMTVCTPAGYVLICQ